VPIPRTLAWDAGKLKHVDKQVLCTRAGNAQQKRRLNLAMNRLALRRRVLFYSRLLHFHSKRPTRREPVRCNPFDAIHSMQSALQGHYVAHTAQASQARPHLPSPAGIPSAPAPPLTVSDIHHLHFPVPIPSTPSLTTSMSPPTRAAAPARHERTAAFMLKTHQPHPVLLAAARGPWRLTLDPSPGRKAGRTPPGINTPPQALESTRAGGGWRGGGLK